MLLCSCYYSYDTSSYNLPATRQVVTTERSNSGVRCKPSSSSSGVCGSFCHHQRLRPPHSGVAPCTLLLPAVSGGPGLPSSQSDTYRRTSLLYPLHPFCWPSRRRKTHLNQVKPLRHETDGGSNSATRYRRSYSDAKKSSPGFFT